MNNLLINEYPLMVLPGLAKKIGLNEAIILQQVHYWLKTSAKKYDGKTWTYNTYQDWQKQFPFWSERTIRRTIKNLEDGGYLISGNYNKLAYDKTKWYTIDYERLRSETVTNADLSSCGQNDQTMRTNCPDDADKVDGPIPKTSSKTSTDIKNISLQIENLRQRYTNDQLKIIDDYLEMIRHTRKSGKISESVILKMYESWNSYPTICVEYGLYVHTSNVKYHSKKENYTLGIIRGTTADEAERNLKKISSAEGKEQNGIIDYFADKEFDE